MNVIKCFFDLLYLICCLYIYFFILIMAVIQLGTTTKTSTFIILISLLSVTLLLTFLIVYKKRHLFGLQRDNQLWNFIIIDSPEHMSRLKEKTSSFLSFTTRQRQKNSLCSMTSTLNHDEVIMKYSSLISLSSSSSVISLPPPTYHHHYYYSTSNLNRSFSSLSSF
ncbi:uncharacterized protein BX663DRAFT_66048 [Cokeromyces recurvatus]|uniref:uncharacterized protein n=1 Tax=Cokeromyces recurvatus TaxID=90255 RepID=UPI00221F0DE6|nr:uncharacterized protein BX663DRAFT_66048 [Cokeromyces recurvatus]KAI7902673.1 hypothetical protein BX663DRAFT_66048 [Cokeromyces recurvatus]